MDVEREISITLGEKGVSGIPIVTDLDMPTSTAIGHFQHNSVTGFDYLTHIVCNLSPKDISDDMMYMLCLKLYKARNEVTFWIERLVLDRYSHLLKKESKRPIIWGCGQCMWKCMRYDLRIDVNMISPEITFQDVQDCQVYDSIANLDYEGLSVYRRHSRPTSPVVDMDEEKEITKCSPAKPCLCVANRVHMVNSLKRNTQRFLSNYAGTLFRNIHMGRNHSLGGMTRLRYQNYTRLSDANTTIEMQPPMQHMTCCICIQYISDLEVRLRKKLEHLGIYGSVIELIKQYMYAYHPMPKDVGLLTHSSDRKHVFTVI